ncbi:MAG: CAP domain-containing protein, partial [Burkholderiaceae bacterium]
GQQTPEAVMEGWLKSPGHCANIMSRDYAELGVAFAVNNRSSAGIYWVQVFGTQRRN